MSANSISGRPHLRDGIDKTILSAWEAGEMKAVVLKAKSLHMTKADSYYKAVEITARSMLDTPGEQYTGIEYVDRLVREQQIEIHPDALDLLQYSCRHARDVDWKATFGVLYSRLVKFYSTKFDRKHIRSFCDGFYACAFHCDWEHAQEIATVLDQKVPNDQGFHFNRIWTTLVVSKSVKEKSFLLNLARAMVGNARKLRDQTPADEEYPNKCIKTEEETLLWLTILIQSGTDAALATFKRSKDGESQPVFGPLKALSEGYVEVFRRIMQFLEKHEQWDDIWITCREVFEKGIEFRATEKRLFEAEKQRKAAKAKKDAENAAKDTEKAANDTTTGSSKKRRGKKSKKLKEGDAENAPLAKKEDHAASGQPTKRTNEEVRLEEKLSRVEAKEAAKASAFCKTVVDWSLWDIYIRAAQHRQNPNNSYKLVSESINKLCRLAIMRPLHDRQQSLANLHTLFFRPRSTIAPELESARISSLSDFVEKYWNLKSCFEDLKPFLETLEWDEINEFLLNIGVIGSNVDNDMVKNVMITTLRLRFKYLFSTSAKTLFYDEPSVFRCRVCNSVEAYGRCETCLSNIAKACLWTYKTGFTLNDLNAALEVADLDPFSDLCIVGATCLLKLAGIDKSRKIGISSALSSANVGLFLQALVWLDFRMQQLPLKTNAPIRVLLVKLYLLIGCISHAKMIWDTLEVKNVLLDSIGPHLFDRLYSLNPGLWADEMKSPMRPFVKYYTTTFESYMPAQLKNSLEAGSYNSALGLLDAKETLQRSCTLVMSVIEDSRGLRAMGRSDTYEMTENPLMSHLAKTDDPEPVVATDYAMLPNHEDTSKRPIQDLIGIGPGLSSVRSCLDLMSGIFLDAISDKDPREYAPNINAQTKMRECVAEISILLSLKIIDYLCVSNSRDLFTSHEHIYYNLLGQLTDVVCTFMRADLGTNSPRPRGSSEDLIRTVPKLLMDQADLVNTLPETTENLKNVFHAFASLHGLGMLLHSIFAIKQSVKTTILLCSKPAMPSWMVSDLKIISESVKRAEDIFKARVQEMKDGANESGWMDRLSGWTFPGFFDGSKEVDESEGQDADFESMLFNAVGRESGIEMWVGQITDSWQEVTAGWGKVKLD